MPYAGIISPASVERAAADGKTPAWSAAGRSSWANGRPASPSRWCATRSTPGAPELGENRGAPYLEQLVFKVIPDATHAAGRAAGRRGRRHLRQQPGPPGQAEAESRRAARRGGAQQPDLPGFQHREAALRRCRVRQALAHAVNKEEILSLALGGLGQRGVRAAAADPAGLRSRRSRQHELGYRSGEGRGAAGGGRLQPGRDGVWAKDGQPLRARCSPPTARPTTPSPRCCRASSRRSACRSKSSSWTRKAVMEAIDRGQVRPAAVALRLERPGRPEHLPGLRPDRQHQPGLLQQPGGGRAAGAGRARAGRGEAPAALRRSAEADPGRCAVAAALRPAGCAGDQHAVRGRASATWAGCW